MEHVRAYIELAVELGSVIQTTDPEKALQRDRDLIANPTMLRPIAPRLGLDCMGARRRPRPRAPRSRGFPTECCSMTASAIVSRCWRNASSSMRCRRRRAKMDGANTVLVVAETEEAPPTSPTLQRRAVVIRPDRHILGVASTPAELDAVLGAPASVGARKRNISRRTPRNARQLSETGEIYVASSRVPSNSVDHVGSLKRPPELVRPWREWEERQAFRRTLRGCKTAPSAMPSRCRRALGLPIVTDGEFRRGGWSRGFLNAVEGFDFRASKLTFRNDDGFSTASPAPVASKPVRRSKPIVTEDFKFIKSVAKSASKSRCRRRRTCTFGQFKDAVDPKRVSGRRDVLERPDRGISSGNRGSTPRAVAIFSLTKFPWRSCATPTSVRWRRAKATIPTSWSRSTSTFSTARSQGGRRT
jgi:hypothetical protein